MNQIILSVVVTSYNYKQYIGETLTSLVNQSTNNIEIIVVDDGSTDGSVELIKNFCDLYPNIYLYQHEGKINKGLPASTYLGIEKAKGKYIAFCESDDYWDKNHTTTILNYLKNNPSAKILFNKIKLINELSSKDVNNYVVNSNKFLLTNNGKNIFLHLTKNYMPTFSAACIKRDLLLKCDFDSYHPQYLDFWIWRQVCFKYPIHFTSDAITYWRRHSKSYDSKENISDITQFLLESNKIIEKENPIPFIEKANIALFKLLHKNRYKIIEYEMEKIYKNTHKNI